MIAEIIAVGTEILMGSIDNTNASWLSKQLIGIGIGTYYHQVVGDNPKRMHEAIELASQRSDIIIITGGLGPTRDDITKDILAEYLEESLVNDPDQQAKLEEYYQQSDRVITEMDLHQVKSIANGLSLFNFVGFANGVIYSKLQNNQPQTFIVLPGPPFEMKDMFVKSVKPYLLEHYQNDQKIASHFLNFCGIGEANVAIILDDLIEKQDNPTIAMYADPGTVQIRLTANGHTDEEVNELLNRWTETIIERLRPYYVTDGEQFDYGAWIVQQLLENNYTISTAESLTGGMIAEMLSQVPGVSSVLYGGEVTYQIKAKEELLGIDPSLIQTYGVVSEEVASAMAEAVQEKTNTSIAIAVTGVAGPEMVDNREVGEVFLALKLHSGEIVVNHKHFGAKRSREMVRYLTVMEAFNMIRKYVFNK